MLAVIPLVGTTFGMFGMGQDEGVYQAKAIGYVYGYNNNFMTFDEYGDCVSASDKSDYMAAIGNHLEGYNFTLDEEQVQGVAQMIQPAVCMGYIHSVRCLPYMQEFAAWSI